MANGEKINIYLSLSEDKILNIWKMALEKEKFEVIAFKNFSEYKIFLETSNQNKKFISIIELHPQICEYENLIKSLENDKTSIIVCGKNLNNSMIAEILLKGAIDYIDTGIDPLILIAKVIAHLRRIADYKRETLLPSFSKNIISANGELKIYPAKMSVIMANKKEIGLTKKEISLLALLIANENKVVKRTDILENIWKEKAEDINSQTLDKYIQILREKLNSLGQNIKTIYGLGYMYKSK